MNDEFDKNDSDFEEKTTVQKIKEWTQKNIRIITSILIVCLIGFSVYSYSNRGEETVATTKGEDNGIEAILDDLVSDTDKDTDEVASDEATISEGGAEITAENTENTTVVEEATTKTTAPAEVQETENSFVEVASSGDGTTHLARRALAHYLEKNPNNELSAEHKIYIEDYLRKNINHSGQLEVGQTVEFSKSLISDAIASAQNLNDSQLQNLQKYSANVQF